VFDALGHQDSKISSLCLSSTPLSTISCKRLSSALRASSSSSLVHLDVSSCSILVSHHNLHHRLKLAPSLFMFLFFSRHEMRLPSSLASPVVLQRFCLMSFLLFHFSWCLSMLTYFRLMIWCICVRVCMAILLSGGFLLRSTTDYSPSTARESQAVFSASHRSVILISRDSLSLTRSRRYGTISLVNWFIFVKWVTFDKLVLSSRYTIGWWWNHPDVDSFYSRILNRSGSQHVKMASLTCLYSHATSLSLLVWLISVSWWEIPLLFQDKATPWISGRRCSPLFQYASSLLLFLLLVTTEPLLSPRVKSSQGLPNTQSSSLSLSMEDSEGWF
jgi:hypothetical protein